jgi:hypothetical protein
VGDDSEEVDVSILLLPFQMWDYVILMMGHEKAIILSQKRM